MIRSIPASGVLDPDRLKRIDGALRAAWEQQQFSGATWVILKSGEIAARGAIGHQAGERSPAVTPESTLFDLASLTKPLATATSVLYLFDRGEFLLGDELRRFFPEAGSQWSGITIRHLLTHTSGLPPYATFHNTRRGVDEIREGIFALEMQASPGEKYDYSCLGYITLQNVVQKVSGESLDKFAARRFFQPLGLKDTLYLPGEDRKARVAMAGLCPHRGREVHAEVHDPLAWAAGGVSGNAGLYSTAEEVARLGGALLSAAVHRDDRLFSPAALQLMLTNQIDPKIGGQSLGFFAYPNGMLPRGDLLPTTAVGHTGFTGTSIVLAPELELVAVLLTNCLFYGPDKGSFLRTRRLFYSLVGACLPAA